MPVFQCARYKNGPKIAEKRRSKKDAPPRFVWWEPACFAAGFIVNTLKNRWIPIFKLGSYAAWFKRGMIPLLNCVNYIIR